MLLRALQRVVRIAPGPVRWAWNMVPPAIRKIAGPFVYPIAAGKRGGSLVLTVPSEGAPSLYDVIVPPVLAGDERLPALRARGHRVLVLRSGESLEGLVRRESVTDGVVLDASGAAPFGLRRHDAALFADPDDLDLAFPKVTIVVVTWKNAALCAACLDGVRRNTPFPELEVVVVDNGSGDGTAEALEARAARDPSLTVIANRDNRGFARATNQGLARATGEYVVLLNDDTVPGPGWLSRLVAHLEADPSLGLVCPVTNEIGNDARVAVSYDALDGMEAFARARTRDFEGKRRGTQVIALFCAVARKATLDAVGGLDERYEVGMFEDDDLSLALKRRGLGLAVADDAFVHHVGQASFSRLSDAEYLRVWEANRRRYEEKWGIRYLPPDDPARPA